MDIALTESKWLFPDKSVVIPTKNRPLKQPAAKIFKNAILLVEPQDKEAYLKAGYKDRIKILPENDKGIAFARNFILDNSERRVIMIDDDIDYVGKFLRFHNGFLYYIKCDDISGLLRRLFDNTEIMTGIVHKTECAYNPTAKTIRRLWGFVSLDACSLRKLKLRYERESELFEDFGLMLSILSSGLTVKRILNYSFSCPKVGSNTGGLNDGARCFSTQMKSLNYLMSKYGFIDVKMKDRGPEPKIKWPIKYKYMNVLLSDETKCFQK